MQLIQMTGITKNYTGTIALSKVNFCLNKGEILSLLGENGAGKSTLMKILYGMERPDEGEIFFNGEKVNFNSPNEAIARGICMVHQHFMLVPAFSVTDNIIAGVEPIKSKIFVDREQAIQQIEELIKKYKFRLDPNAKIESLSVGEQQRVEILKALYRQADILILDEPSAVLTPHEVDELFITLRELREQGTSIVIITHKLRETMSIADRIMVLRDGHLVADSIKPGETSIGELSERMVGRQIRLDNRKPSQCVGPMMFSVRNLTVTDQRGIERVKNISFGIHQGEILGVAGVEGNGQSQILQAVTGMINPDSMELMLNGKIISGGTRTFIDCGVGHVPEDRSTLGLVGDMSVKGNLILGYHGCPDICKRKFMKWKDIHKYGERCRQNFQVKTPDIDAPVSSLSGGNQQKVVMARILSRQQEILVAAHPTRGLDVGAIEYVHQKIFEFRDQGKSVLLVSAELDEVVRLSDRLIVMYEGNIVVECDPTEFTKTQLGLLMTGSTLDAVRGEAS